MYLTRDRNSMYYTRIPLPKTLRDAGYPACLRFSLHTKDRRTASQRNLATAYSLKQEIDQHVPDDGPDALLDSASNRIQALRRNNAWGLPAAPSNRSGNGSRHPKRARSKDKGIQSRLQAFLHSKSLQGVSPRSVRQLETRIGRLCEHVGPGTPLSQIRTKAALTFRDHLMTNGLGPKTVKEYLASCRQFFAWAVLCEYTRHNAFDGVQPPSSARRPAHQSRQCWSANDLGTLFKLERFKKQKPLYQTDYLITCILLYSGMRPAEVCQLRVDDVSEVEGRLCFRVRDDGAGQKLKNAHARRDIPVHRELLRLGLNQWRARRQAAQEIQLFDLSPSATYGEWSAAYLRRVSKALRANQDRFDGKPELYGLRHTVIDQLKQKGLPEPVVAALAGHSERTMTFGLYGKRSPLSALAEAIDQLDFDLSLAPMDFSVE